MSKQIRIGRYIQIPEKVIDDLGFSDLAKYAMESFHVRFRVMYSWYHPGLDEWLDYSEIPSVLSGVTLDEAQMFIGWCVGLGFMLNDEETNLFNAVMDTCSETLGIQSDFLQNTSKIFLEQCMDGKVVREIINDVEYAVHEEDDEYFIDGEATVEHLENNINEAEDILNENISHIYQILHTTYESLGRYLNIYSALKNKPKKINIFSKDDKLYEGDIGPLIILPHGVDIDTKKSRKKKKEKKRLWKRKKKD